MNWQALILFAQTDPLSGGAGWAGVGLLGAVLGWLLLRHLPAKDAQFKELIDAKDALLASLLVRKDQQIDAQRKEFIDSLSESSLALSEGLRRMADEVGGMTEFFRKRAEASAKRKGVIK